MARETSEQTRNAHRLILIIQLLNFYLLWIAQIQFVLCSLQALYLATAWWYVLDSPHDAASICLIVKTKQLG